MAESAICLGERGTCGLRSCEPPDPVTAQVMKTSRFIASGIEILPIEIAMHVAQKWETDFGITTCIRTSQQ
jgi:hypothetical protein